MLDTHIGTPPQFTPLGLPGFVYGIHYTPVILENGELVVYIGGVQHQWVRDPNSKLYPMRLANAYTGDWHHHKDLARHVDRVCDRRLDKIGS